MLESKATLAENVESLSPYFLPDYQGRYQELSQSEVILMVRFLLNAYIIDWGTRGILPQVTSTLGAVVGAGAFS